MAPRRSFGSVRQLPGGRWQARYTGPDRKPHRAPNTFGQRRQAERWLERVRVQIDDGVWVSPDELARIREEGQTFAQYAERWLERRDLKPRTKLLYRSILDRDLLPTFADSPLSAITEWQVENWYDRLDPEKRTARAHAYSLFRTIMKSAVKSKLIPANPVDIEDASSAKRRRAINPATLEEVDAIAAAMPEKYAAAVKLSAWLALRFGELAELRRKDIDLKHMIVNVHRGVTQRSGQTFLGSPKSEAGIRDIPIPPGVGLEDLLADHLEKYAQTGRDGLVFPAAGAPREGKAGAHGHHLAASTLYKSFNRAREKAGRPDLRWHDLRHTGNDLAAQANASLREQMHRMGHASVTAALRYQHRVAGRDAELARRMAELASRGDE